MRSFFLLSAAWVVSFGALAGCTNDDENRPPGVALGAGGAVPIGSGSGGRGGGTGGSGAGGSAGATGEPVDVEGLVTVFTTDDFDLVNLFEGTAEVQAQAFGGGFVSTTYDRNTGERFMLTGVDSFEPWFVTTPDSPLGEEMCAISRPDLSDLASVSAHLVQRSVPETVLASLAQGFALEADRGHVFLFFQQGVDSGLEGVSIDPIANGVVAYNIQQTWTDAVFETDTSGRIAMFNVEAVDVPTVRTLTGTFDGSAFAIDVLVGRDCTTVGFFTFAGTSP